MGAETRGELPAGFVWQEVPELRAAFPKPDGWFYRYQSAPGTLACFITREQITTEGFVDAASEEAAKKASESGFKTGLSVNVIDNYGLRMARSVVAAARGMITEPREPLALLTQVKRRRNDPLMSYSGEFHSKATRIGDTPIHPIHYHIEITGNPKTDRLYILNFETPEELWGQDKEIAQTIIDNRVLDRSL